LEKEDYLLKQINQLGQVLGKLFAKLIGLKTNDQVFETFDFTNKLLKEELDFDIEYLVTITNEEFELLILNNLKFNNSNLESFADMLVLVADIFYFRTEKHKNIYEKALKIYEYLNKKDLTYSFERQNKIINIKSY